MQSELALSYCNNSSSDKMKDLESNIDAIFNFYCKVDINVVLQDQFFLESVYILSCVKRLDIIIFLAKPQGAVLDSAH